MKLGIGQLIKWIRNTEGKYIIFGIIGGFYFSDEFEPWIKRYWLCISLLSNSSYFSMVISYFEIAKNSNWKTISYVFVLAECVVSSAVFIPLLTYYFRNELSVVLHLNNGEDKSKVENSNHLQRMKRNIKIIISILCLGWGINLGFIVYSFLATNDEYLRDENFHLIPNLLISKTNSRYQYISMTFFYGLITFSPSWVIYCFSINVLIATYEFYVSFTILHKRIAEFAKNSTTSFNYLNEKYFNYCENLKTKNSFKKSIEFERRRLIKEITDVIEVYQSLRRKLKNIKTFIESLFSVSSIFLILVELLLITAFYSPSMNSVNKFKGTIFAIIVPTVWLCYCYAGMIFTSMEEMIATQVYNLPWYCLDPVQKKTFFIFLHLTQRPIRFNGFKIYPMGMPIFLQVAKLGYTYFNFLNTFYRRKNRMTVYK